MSFKDLFRGESSGPGPDAVTCPDPPDRVFWDMCLVIPAKAKDLVPAPRKRDRLFDAVWGRSDEHAPGSEKKTKYDAVFIAKRLAGAGLRYACFKSIQGDEVLVRVGATARRLEDQADTVDFKVKLDAARTRAAAERGFPSLGIKPILISNATPEGAAVSRYGPYDHVHGKYEPDPPLNELYSRAADGRCFNSMQRLKLLELAITSERRFGGAEIQIARRIKQGKILAALAMHDPEERNALYDAFVLAPPTTLPNALPLAQFKDYFGEKISLFVGLAAHLTGSYAYIAFIGIAIQIDTIVEGNVAAKSVAAYALVAVLWGVLTTEFWKRRERELALEWGTVGFEATELVRPQFKGVKMPSPVTGKPAVFFPKGKRDVRVTFGALVTIACILLDLLFVYACIAVKNAGRIEGDDPSPEREAAARRAHWGGTVLQGAGIPVFQAAFVAVAVAMTDAENWQTETVYNDKLIQKLTVFNFINSYTSLFYAVFVPRAYAFLEGTCRPVPEGTASAAGDAPCFYDLRGNLFVIFLITIFTNNAVATGKAWVKYALAYFLESRGLGRETPEFSVPELNYVMVEFDETLDTIVAYQAQAIQYGYVILFSCAFPAAPAFALLNNALLLRTTCFNLLCVYRRVQPSGAEDIGHYQAIFEGLNVAGAVSNSAIICFRTPIFGGSPHHKDVAFVSLVAAFFSLVTLVKVVTDDAHPDVLLQIERQAFINSKIVDKIADEEDTLTFRQVDRVEVEVARRDALDGVDQPYYESVRAYFGRGAAAPRAPWGIGTSQSPFPDA